MIIRIEPDDGLTAFERKYLFTEAKGDRKKDRKNVRQIDIDLSDDKPKPRINGNATDADDIDLDDTDDVDLSELDDAAATSDTSIDIEPPDEDDPNADIDDADSDDIAIDDESDDGTTEPDDADMPADDDAETTVTANTAADDSGGEDTAGGDDVVTEPEDDTDSTDDSSTDSDSDSGDDNSSDDGGNSDDTGNGDDVAIEPDSGGDSGDDSGSNDQGSSDSGDDDSEDDSSESPEDKEEALHKQALFSKFQNLYESISTYNTKLDGVVGKTNETNHQYKEINDNLKQVRDFLYDYMVIKFKDVSYTESMLFYQRAIAVVNLSMDQLETVKKSERDK